MANKVVTDMAPPDVPTGSYTMSKASKLRAPQAKAPTNKFPKPPTIRKTAFQRKSV